MKILVIEDDRNLAEMVKNSLASGDNAVDMADNGGDGAFMARSFDYDMIILDNDLPKKNGLTICKELRALGKTTPILFLTVDGEMTTKMAAFESGADDYLLKPFSLQELHARIKAITRRPTVIQKNTIRVADLEMDTEKHLVVRGTRRIHPTRKEFTLLEYFMRNQGIVLSRALIMEHVWTAESNPFSNTVEAHIRNLRTKISAGGRPNLIVNVPGRGYVMDTPENLRKM